jgi:hypothetical protein
MYLKAFGKPLVSTECVQWTIHPQFHMEEHSSILYAYISSWWGSNAGSKSNVLRGEIPMISVYP